jgi:crotonobetainyl-CoA:carnitine CoA-transferase CaiB-like acyl-CoA transferase
VAHGIGIQHPSICPYEPFPTADRLLVIAAGNNRQFQALCDCLGLPHLKDDPRFSANAARVANRELLTPTLATALQTRGADEWFETLTSAGVPCGPINDVSQGIHFAESLGLEPIVDVHGSAQIANPLRLSATGVSYRHRPPALGEDEKEILAWLDTEESALSDLGVR